jgi:hypothetical protein
MSLRGSLQQRLEKLERGKGDTRVFLAMVDGTSRTIRVPSKRALLGTAVRIGREGLANTRELTLLAQSTSVAEPDGSHMAELARAILLSPQPGGRSG